MAASSVPGTPPSRRSNRSTYCVRMPRPEEVPADLLAAALPSRAAPSGRSRRSTTASAKASRSWGSTSSPVSPVAESGPGCLPPCWPRPAAPSTSPRRRSARTPRRGSSGQPLRPGAAERSPSRRSRPGRPSAGTPGARGRAGPPAGAARLGDHLLEHLEPLRVVAHRRHGGPGQHEMGARARRDPARERLEYADRILEPVPARHLDHVRLDASGGAASRPGRRAGRRGRECRPGAGRRSPVGIRPPRSRRTAGWRARCSRRGPGSSARTRRSKAGSPAGGRGRGRPRRRMRARRRTAPQSRTNGSRKRHASRASRVGMVDSDVAAPDDAYAAVAQRTREAGRLGIVEEGDVAGAHEGVQSRGCCGPSSSR